MNCRDLTLQSTKNRAEMFDFISTITIRMVDKIHLGIRVMCSRKAAVLIVSQVITSLQPTVFSKYKQNYVLIYNVLALDVAKGREAVTAILKRTQKQTKCTQHI
jgi:hypothetical protein